MLGGAGSIALRLANALSPRTRGCHVWVPEDGPAREMAKELGLPSHKYDARRIASSSKLQSAIANLNIAYRLRGYGRGIIHVHSPRCYGALRLGLRYSGLKRAVHVQIEESRTGLRWAFKRPPDMIITCARYLVDYVRGSLPEEYQERQRIVAVPNSIDTKEFFPDDKCRAKHRVGAPDDVPLILMLANLAPHKGQVTAIRMTAELQRRGVAVVCWLAGVEREEAGTYTSQLHSLINELGLSDRIRLLGQRHDASELLRAADFFLLPSSHEGLPLSILEAQASKVPALTAPTAGIPEAVSDGETGILIPSEDYVGYADAIQTLLSNKDLYHRVVENAYEQVRREYDWSNYCERIWKLYCELLGGWEKDNGQPMIISP